MKLFNKLKWLALTHWGRILTLFVLIILTQIIMDKVNNCFIFDISYYISAVSSIILLPYLLVMIFVAIKNTLKK